MEFKTINWKLRNGSIAETVLPENKVDIALEKLNEHTSAWVKED